MAASLILTVVSFSMVLSANVDDVEMRYVSPWIETMLHNMRSRRFFTHNASLNLMKRQHMAPTLSAKKKSTTISLFLVRSENRNRTELYTELQRVSTYVRYFFKDTFVAALSADDVSTWSATEIFELPSAMKIQPELFIADRHGGMSEPHRWGHRIRRSGTESKCAAVQLSVALISTTPSIEIEIDSLCSESSEHANMGLCRLKPGSGSLRKRVVDTDECVQHLAAERLASHPLVTWVEIRSAMRLRNKYATRIVQSRNGASRTLWEKGLKGEGEVEFLILILKFLRLTSNDLNRLLICRSSVSRTRVWITIAVSFEMNPLLCRRAWVKAT
jgi:hypothetical protein